MLLKQFTFLIILSAVVILVGCSNREINRPADYSQRIYIKTEKPVGKEATLTWQSSERSGAAYHAESYDHVLTNQNNTVEIHEFSSEPSFTYPPDPKKIIEQISTKSYSIYETKSGGRCAQTGDRK